jgi:hypothetical protein
VEQVVDEEMVCAVVVLTEVGKVVLVVVATVVDDETIVEVVVGVADVTDTLGASPAPEILPVDEVCGLPQPVTRRVSSPTATVVMEPFLEESIVLNLNRLLSTAVHARRECVSCRSSNLSSSRIKVAGPGNIGVILPEHHSVAFTAAYHFVATICDVLRLGRRNARSGCEFTVGSLRSASSGLPVDIRIHVVRPQVGGYRRICTLTPIDPAGVSS